jgi:ATP-dependent RNA helicase DeaD
MNLYRSGRTARAGAKGLSLTVLQEEECKKLPTLKRTGNQIHEFKKNQVR